MAIRTTGVRYDVIARDSASRTFNQVGGSASKLERTLGKVGKAVGVMGVALTAGLAAGLGESLHKAVEFQSEMLKIQTQAGASAKDVKYLSGKVLELGKTAEQGPQQLSEALYHLKSVGMDNVQAMSALKTASDLAAVGGSDLEATTNALAGAWRTGIRGAEDFGKTAATVNAIIGAGNMKMQDMVSALGTGILPTAKTFGLTLAQVGGALALFTDEGIDSASAATRLRMSISLLAAPSKAAEKQLKKIGLTGNMLGQAMRSPDGIIGAIKLLSVHLEKSGLDATHQAALLSRAFGGGKSSSAILSMVNNLDVLEQKQKQINSSMGKYGPAVAAQRKTAAAQLKIIRSNLEVIAIKTGNVLLPPFTGMVTYITKTALPAVHNFGHEMATRLVPVDQIKGSFATAQGLLSDFIDGLTPTPKKKTVRVPTPQIKGPTIPPMLRRPYTFTVPSPQLKGAKTSIPSMIAAPKKQDSEAKKLGVQLRGLISGGLGDAVKGIDWGKLGQQIGTGLGTAIGWVGKHLADLTKKLIDALSKLDYVGIGKSFGKMAIPLSIGIINSLFDPLFSLSFWKKNWLDVIEAVLLLIPIGRLGGALAKVFSKVPVLKAFAPLLEGVGKLGKLVEKPAGKILEGVWAVVKAVGRGFVTGFEKVFPETSRALSRKLDDLVLAIFGYTARAGAAGLRIVEAVGNGILGGARFVGSAIGQLAGWVVKPFARAGTWLLVAGGALVNGLLQGVGTSLAGVGGWLKGHLVDPIVGWVKGLFGIHSPSTVFAGIGGDLVRGLMSGVGSAAAGIGKWLYGNVVAPVLHAFSGAGGWLVSRGQQVVDGLEAGAWSLAKGVGGWMSTNVVNKVTGAFTGAGSWLYDKGTSVMSGLLQGLKDGFKNITDYLGSTVKNTLSNVGGLVGKIPGLATGGLAPMGSLAWVGENGPELMRVTPAGARVYSHRQSMGMVASGDAEVRRMAATAAAVRGRTSRPSSSQGRPQETVVHVHFNDRRLMDLIDVEVEGGVTVAKKYTDGRLKESAHRAKAGRVATR